mmetsp:Transcript_70612/g.151313  ORF Transcript_70612/g.151313 Transcript_70612/m.151313 type:complete len:292 (-) Transcript_70612:208-1083(-)
MASICKAGSSCSWSAPLVFCLSLHLTLEGICPSVSVSSVFFFGSMSASCSMSWLSTLCLVLHGASSNAKHSASPSALRLALASCSMMLTGCFPLPSASFSCFSTSTTSGAFSVFSTPTSAGPFCLGSFSFFSTATAFSFALAPPRLPLRPPALRGSSATCDNDSSTWAGGCSGAMNLASGLALALPFWSALGLAASSAAACSSAASAFCRRPSIRSLFLLGPANTPFLVGPCGRNAVGTVPTATATSAVASSAFSSASAFAWGFASSLACCAGRSAAVAASTVVASSASTC